MKRSPEENYKWYWKSKNSHEIHRKTMEIYRILKNHWDAKKSMETIEYLLKLNEILSKSIQQIIENNKIN